MKRLWILLAALCCMLALFFCASVCAEDQLPGEIISLSVPDLAPAGQNLSFTWTPAEGETGQNLSVSLEDAETGELLSWNDWGSSDTDPYTFTIPGHYLEAGSYNIYAYWYTGDPYAEKRFPFTVTDNPDRPAAPQITLNVAEPTTVTSSYEFNLGKTYDRYYGQLFEQQENGEWVQYSNYESSEWDSNSIYYFSNRLHVGQWKAVVSGLEGDTWSLPGTLLFTVTQAPQLAEAELAESIGNIGLNSRFSIKLQPVENAGWYNAVLQSELSGENVASAVYYVNESNPPEVITLVFNSWDETAEPGAYRIKVTAHGIGYEDSVTEFTNLTVYQTETPAAPTEVYQNKAGRIPMTAEERANVVINSYLRVTVTYPQVMQAVECEIYQGEPNGSPWDSYSYNLVTPDTTWYHDALRMLYQLGDYSFRVRVLTADNLWSEWSEPIFFTVVPPPTLSKPTVVPDKTAFALGEDLTLTITGIDPEATNLSVEAGTFSETFYQLAEPLVITIPQEYFSADTNQVLVAVSASGHSSGVTTFEITVSGEAPAAPAVTFSATTGAYMETIYADVEAPGATEVCMDMFGSHSYLPARNGAARVPIQIFSYGPRRLQVRFRALVNGVWSEWTDYTRITFPERPTISQDQEWVILPEEIIPGQDLEVTLLPAEGVSLYQINLYSSLHPNEYINESLMFSKTYDHPGVIRIPAAAFAESGRYWFHNCAGIPGAVDLLVANSKLYQVETYSGVIPLNISTDSTELAYEEKAEISLGGVQASRVLWEYSRVLNAGSTADPWLGLNEFEVPEGETVSGLKASFYPPEGGTFSVRVMAQVDGVWTAWSNSLTFHVSPRENGKLRNPVPQAAESVPAGQPLRVTWEAAEHAESYTVTWSKNGSIETTELFAEIPTASLEPGEYSVSVKSSARGYENDGHLYYAFFTVEDHGIQPDLSDYSLKLKLNTTELSLNGRFVMTASVTDSNGDPVSGVDVGFRVVDSEWNDVDFYGTGDSVIWNTTPESGKIALGLTYSADGRRILKPAGYKAVVFFVDDDSIYDAKEFEFRLDSLHLPSELKAIEAEAFACTDSQAIFVPEGCVSIGERAFADCSQLYYIHIPASVTDIADNAFEGCPDCLWIDRE